MSFRIGFGYDVHAFTSGLALWLGGVKIPYSKGLAGHSDADVLIHALCDALLGAANLRDIGYHFPDDSADFKNIDSKILLKKTISLIRSHGYELTNVDCTVCAEAPRLQPHISNMQTCLAEVMQVDTGQVSIKATTSEKMGFVGRNEGIAAYAVALINQII